jgi:hypothetical protein
MAPERVWRGAGEGHLIAVASRVFLKQDHVGPGRQGRPVLMRTASPGPTVPVNGCPAALSPTTVHGPGMSA